MVFFFGEASYCFVFPIFSIYLIFEALISKSIKNFNYLLNIHSLGIPEEGKYPTCCWVSTFIYHTKSLSLVPLHPLPLNLTLHKVFVLKIMHDEWMMIIPLRVTTPKQPNDGPEGIHKMMVKNMFDFMECGLDDGGNSFILEKFRNSYFFLWNETFLSQNLIFYDEFLAP